VTPDSTAGDASAAQQPEPQQPAPTKPDVTVLATPSGAGEGVVRCPKCGASDVSLKPGTNTLMCAFCHHEWAEERLDDIMGLSVGIDKLKGTTITTAAAKISDTTALVTLKCTGCGAEVVIDTTYVGGVPAAKSLIAAESGLSLGPRTSMLLRVHRKS
jgi:predicted RNA-binding Zn-ribbon protein involved in translation (DUF1610 family)